MKRTTQRRVSFAVLALALTALGVDRLVLNGGVTAPRESHAATLVTVAGAERTAAAAPRPPAPESKAPALPTLAERFELAARSLPERPVDGFAIPAAWKPVQADIEIITAEGAPSLPEVDLRAFASAHKLSAVVVRNGAGLAAIVNDQAVRLGEVVDGLTLAEVGARSATFSDALGHRVVLELEQPQTARGRAKP
ncbi:MAG: hypothetical protein SFY95_02630 [Planctomycetota bacterium]|nr:hypothetical protein [Planctomycetota bacterium]